MSSRKAKRLSASKTSLEDFLVNFYVKIDGKVWEQETQFNLIKKGLLENVLHRRGDMSPETRISLGEAVGKCDDGKALRAAVARCIDIDSACGKLRFDYNSTGLLATELDGSEAFRVPCPPAGKPSLKALLTSDDPPPAYKAGDAVEVWSNSQKAWCSGTIQKVEEDLVHVSYVLKQGEPRAKIMPIGHERVRFPGAGARNAVKVGDLEKFLRSRKLVGGTYVFFVQDQRADANTSIEDISSVTIKEVVAECPRPRKDPDEEQRRKVAAVRVQKMYRGYRGRQVCDYLVWRRSEAAAAAAVQCRRISGQMFSPRGGAAHAHTRNSQGSAEPPTACPMTRTGTDEDQRKQLAAVRVQKVYRGFHARKQREQMANQSSQSPPESPKDFMTIRELWSGRVEGQRKQVAAVRVQRMYRSYRARKLREKRVIQSLRKKIAALRVQKMYRGYRARKLLEHEVIQNAQDPPDSPENFIAPERGGIRAVVSYKGAHFDWPLSRDEKKSHIMSLYDRELQALGSQLPSGELSPRARSFSSARWSEGTHCSEGDPRLSDASTVDVEQAPPLHQQQPAALSVEVRASEGAHAVEQRLRQAVAEAAETLQALTGISTPARCRALPEDTARCAAQPPVPAKSQAAAEKSETLKLLAALPTPARHRANPKALRDFSSSNACAESAMEGRPLAAAAQVHADSAVGSGGACATPRARRASEHRAEEQLAKLSRQMEELLSRAEAMAPAPPTLWFDVEVPDPPAGRQRGMQKGRRKATSIAWAERLKARVHKRRGHRVTKG